MTDALEVIIPLLNPNEPEVQVVEVMVTNGQEVSPGEVLCLVETTKSSHEVSAEHRGYVVSLGITQGDKLRAGSRLCWLAKDPGWTPPVPPDPAEAPETDGVPAGIRITKPALELAEASGYILEELPVDRLITEDVMHKLLSEAGEVGVMKEQPLDRKALVIYGGGGHGKALIDLIRAIGSFNIVGIVDDGLEKDSQVMDVPILGGAEQLKRLVQEGVRQAINAVGGIGDMNSRIQVFQRLKAHGFEFPNLIHPTAWVEPGAKLSAGVQVFPHAYVGSEAEIGLGVIVNTRAVISHDCVLQDYVNVAPGALIAGNVTVGEGVLIGMGVTINLNVQVGSGAKIGNSAVVKVDVPVNQVVRAGSIWPPE